MSERKPPLRWSPAWQPTKYNGANPLIRQFFSELNRRKMTQEYFAYHSGVSRVTLREWKRNRGARMDKFVEALAYMGLKLAIVPKEETNAAQPGKAVDTDRLRRGNAAPDANAR